MSYETQGSPDTLRRYRVPGPKPERGSGWGMFVIADDGYFSAITDYGNYAYFWGHAGMAMREFLISLNSDYVERKLMEGRKAEFDAAATKQLVQEVILDKRRRGSFDKNEARAEWDSLHLLDDSSDAWIRQSTLSEPWEYIQERAPANVHAFAYELFPRLQTLLEEQRAVEAVCSFLRWVDISYPNCKQCGAVLRPKDTPIAPFWSCPTPGCDLSRNLRSLTV